jgi:hypothetical protein
MSAAAGRALSFYSSVSATSQQVGTVVAESMANHATTFPAILPLQETLIVWTMSLDDHRAACLLAKIAEQYEAGVVIDEGLAISARGEADEILRLSDRWHERLCSAGWVPDNIGVTVRPKPERRRA